MYFLITTGFEVPLVLVSANSIGDIIDGLSNYAFESYLSAESQAKLYEVARAAKPPNDGMMGCCISQGFTLPETQDLTFWLQLDGDEEDADLVKKASYLVEDNIGA